LVPLEKHFGGKLLDVRGGWWGIGYRKKSPPKRGLGRESKIEETKNNSSPTVENWRGSKGSEKNQQVWA